MVAENQRTAPRAKRNVVRERVLYARAGNRPDAVDVLGAFRLGYFGDARRGQQPEQHTALHPALLVDERFQEPRSEEHTSELQSLMRISYAVFCLKKKKKKMQKHKVQTQYYKQKH